MSGNVGRGRPLWPRSGNADSGANWRGQTNQRAFQRPHGINRGRSGGGSNEGHHRNAGASLPITRYHLSAIVSREDADQLLITLSTKPGWLRLLESDFQSSEFGVIFAALKKCSEASTLDLLRRFMRKSLSSDNFESRCCLMLGALGQGDLRIVEDVVAVLEASAWLQPAGLAKTCMILLASLEGNRAMSSWDMASKLDLSEKLRTTREQFLEAAKASNASRVATQSAPKIFKGYRTSGTASNSFRDMSILPTKEDLEEEHPFLRPNIVAGAYESLEDYLDVQFRLLREDYVTPLRDGLREFKGMGSEFVRWKLRSIQDVRFYTGVSYQRPQESNSVLAIKERIVLLLAPDDFKHVNWARSKRFTNGALIGITKDKFKTIIFATVSNRDPDALRQNGALTLELCFDEEILEFKPDIEFSLIESSGAYFEAYRHNLAVLQSMTDMPFSRNLVFAKKDVQQPSFLSFIPYIDLKPIMKNSRSYEFDLDDRWPLQEDTILNVRQFDAIKSAINNELCVIQGPPGTGKTFVGLKIVELMLLNSFTRKPFLIVCYTNHALDQFVEGISKFTEDIVRLGGRCSSEELEKFTLRALRRRTQGRMTQDDLSAERQKLGRLIWNLKKERSTRTMTLEKIEYNLAALQGRTIFKDCDSFGPNLDKILKLDCIDRIFMQDEEEVDEDALEDDGNLSDEDRGEVEDEDIAVQTKCNTRKEAAIKKMLGSYKQTNDRSLPYTKYKFQRLREFIAEMRRREDEGSVTYPVPPDLELVFEEWWQLYREVHWEKAIQFAQEYLDNCFARLESEDIYVSRTKLEELAPPVRDDMEWAIRCLTTRLTDIRRELLQNLKEFGEAESLLDFEIIKNCKIIGVTTTGAAKYNALLRKVQYEIVVVEEAAEVLEAHLITTLSPSTKQLILIGDHQQLQPSTTVYKLATSFNLQISLFERLINNGIPYVRLQEQHRMRDQFLKLLVPTIYSDYFSHESVFGYENIRGLSQNLFFVTHENSEESEKENSSKSNLFEAEFVACLALHLRMHGYAPSEIVILTTYSGQVFAIRNFIRDIEEKRHWTGMKTVVNREGAKSRVKVKDGLPISMFEGIRITTVDNYQGEESEIVIASFVRSNDDQRIGFLSKDNRVCVALSRAKKGFYCIGNIAMLASKSKTWEDISRVLLQENAVNKGLELYCDIHNYRLMAVSPSDFNEFSDGGCPKLCGLRLSCGHVCPKTCHRLDADHAEFSCQRDCERPRLCGHPCVRRCFQDCGSCMTKVTKRLACGHDAETKCHISPESIACKVVVKKSLNKCSHDADLECSLPVDLHECQKPCERFMPCGVHRCKKMCSLNCGKCMDFVDAASPCGHTVRLQCRDSKDPQSLRDACDTKVEVRLSCGHMNQVPCQQRELAQTLSEKCQQPTEVTCSSGHKFTVKCPIARSGRVDDNCREKTPISLECGHEIVRECRAVRELDRASLRAECKQKVKVEVPCGHDLSVECKQKLLSSSALQKMCQMPIEETLNCGHKLNRKCHESSACTARVTVKASCGHEVRMLCSQKDDAKFSQTQCRAKCGTILQCEHPCSGICCASRAERFHQKCLAKCQRVLFCGHPCSSNCHSQCNPCVVKEKISCPHGVREAECLSSINEPCTRKPQHCTHKKCDALECAHCHCSCDSHCQKNLTCGKSRGKKKGNTASHRCVGLCSELCVCSFCDDGKIRAAKLPHGVNRKAVRFIKLPCSHIFEVSWLDNFMSQHKDLLSFPKCPDCGAQIRLVRRYHEPLERIRLNMRKVYTRVFGDLNETREAFHDFFNKCQQSDRPTKLIDKVIRFSKTPSRYVLGYLEALFLLIDEDNGFCWKAIDSEGLQLQLLSNCFEAAAGNTVDWTARWRPDILKTTPIRVDRWAACDQNHIFSTADHETCPDCPSNVDAIAEDLAQVNVGEEP